MTTPGVIKLQHAIAKKTKTAQKIQEAVSGLKNELRKELKMVDDKVVKMDAKIEEIIKMMKNQ